MASNETNGEILERKIMKVVTWMLYGGKKGMKDFDEPMVEKMLRVQLLTAHTIKAINEWCEKDDEETFSRANELLKVK